MSNLPVLWVPPVTPPDPDERPPKRRGNLGVLLAAVAIVGVPLLAVTVFGETAPKTPPRTEVVEAETTKPATPPAAPSVAAAPSAPAPSLGPAPDTSGGNQPYIAGVPAASPAPASGAAETAKPSEPAPAVSASPATPSPAPVAVEEARPATGPDGRPVRVIGLDRAPADAAPTAPSTPVAAPAERAAVAPITPVEPRGATAEPPASSPPAPVAAAPVEAPATEPAPIVARSEPGVATGGSSASVAPSTTPETVAPKAAEAKPARTPLPPKREAPKTARAGEETGRGASAGQAPDAFADRLAAIRRSEERRAAARAPVEEPPVVEEDEEVVVVPRRGGWGFVPPFFADGPRRPALRSYDPPPPREAMGERAPRGENCHYHAWPTEDMAFHRAVKCHWHRDPDDPSIRYVR